MLEEAAVQQLSVFKLVNPKHNIRIQIGSDSVVEAALLKFAYTPWAPGTMGPRRDRPEIMERAETLNRWQELTITKGKKLWDGRVMPEYAVLVEEVKADKFKFDRAMVFKWPGDIRIQGDPPFGLMQIGELSHIKDGVYYLWGETQVEDRIHREPAEVEITEIETNEDVDAFLDEVNDVKLAAVEVETPQEYTGDKFTQDPLTGHFIGDDGFRVPQNFEEFWERYPYYIRRWAQKRLHKTQVDEEVEDWEMELYSHMKWLPETSKYRTPGYNGRPAGCTDVVETFNPVLQYGASEKRFRNYINMCLGNRFNTIMSKRKKNPICKPGNYSLAAQMDPDNYEIVDDEYVHANSQYLMRTTLRQRKQHEEQLYLAEFTEFVSKEDPSLLRVMDAIASTGTFGEAQRDLLMTDAELTRARNRLKQLRDCFIKGTPVPKQRKPYKKRAAIAGESQ